MTDQEFQKHVLNWMECVDVCLGSRDQNVGWIKGKMEGRSGADGCLLFANISVALG